MEPAVVLSRPAAPLDRWPPSARTRVSDLLAPPGARPLLVRPPDVGGRVAWDLLVRDGALRPVADDAAVAVGAVVNPQTRAAALKPRVPVRAVVTGPTAAWVHCGGTVPERLHLAHRSGTHRPEVWAFATVWSGPGLVADSVRLGEVLVTTPERTALEVALRLPPERALRLVLDLQAAGADLLAASRALERRTRVPGRPRARLVLAEALSV